MISYHSFEFAYTFFITLLKKSVPPSGYFMKKGTKANWLKYKKYIRSHYSENISLRTIDYLNQAKYDLKKTLR